MRSLSKSALLPNSETTFPLTVTRPACINSSALRREVSPACEISFWSLSSKPFQTTTRADLMPQGRDLAQRLPLGNHIDAHRHDAVFVKVQRPGRGVAQIDDT